MLFINIYIYNPNNSINIALLLLRIFSPHTTIKKQFTGTMAELEIELKYHEGRPVIQDIQRVSKPGRRVYSSVKTMPVVQNGLGISILSTPKGVMSDSAARENNVGGEVLCRIF